MNCFSLIVTDMPYITHGNHSYYKVQSYGKSMEYPPNSGINKNLRLGINKLLGENSGNWAEC